ncbi:hypothetical protein Droror1_Dr00014727 [Drosera rotundifolia]
MRRLRAVAVLLLLWLVALVSVQKAVAAPVAAKRIWQTLDGSAPLVVARGGFSGLFPDSSTTAYAAALSFSVSNVILWCDVQLTQDAAGICFPYLTLDNSTDIPASYKTSTYSVNGVPISGHFTIDFTLKGLSNVNLTQGIYSRSNTFDGISPLLTVESVFSQNSPPGFWLNIQHDAFFSSHNLSMRTFVLGVSKTVNISYISSPEVKFLQSIAKAFAATKTKIIFRFLDQSLLEPSTNQTYDSLLQNLTFIKSFASGILVPKTYIWPVDSGNYLQPHTSVVTDAHTAGLQVFGADFANDNGFAYNYSYNPVAEYLSVIDNGEFCVDGVLSDFPITPSEAVECYAHLGANASVQANALVISHNGASGDYPGCTDIAYAQAIADGADVIDCNVQISKDKVPFCLSSINLVTSTTIAQTSFSTLVTTISQLQSSPGIFSFNLTWSEIQGLTPAISNPFANFRLSRNPLFKNAGKLISLSEFLALAQNATTVSGVLVNIENAFYLAEEQGLGVTDAVLNALQKAGYSNKTAKKVLIQSYDSSVLEKFKGKNYELVYNINGTISAILNSTVVDIKTFANSVLVRKDSVVPEVGLFTSGAPNNVVQILQSFGLKVYVQLFQNEFVSQDWDFFSDPTVELNEFVYASGVNGVVTDFPQTATLYKKNRCLTMSSPPAFAGAVPPGGLFEVMNPALYPPAEAPFPVLTIADVSEPALSPAIDLVPAPEPSAPKSRSAHSLADSCSIFSLLTVLVAGFLLF